MNKPTFNDPAIEKGNPSTCEPQQEEDILPQQFKPSRPSRSYVFEASESAPTEGRKVRPSSWDESDNELPLDDEMPTRESGRIYSAEAETGTESVPFKLVKVKEQLFLPFKTNLLLDSTVDLSEFSRDIKSPESKEDSNLDLDRRQTPARVRRRTRSSSSSSPTQDSKILQELAVKAETYDNSSDQQKNELKSNSNNILDDLFSELLNRKTDIFRTEWSTLISKGNPESEEGKESNGDDRKDSETFIRATASEEDFYYCRTLRKLSQILEVEEGKKEMDGNEREGIESLDENSEEKLSKSSLSRKSSQQFDINSPSPVSTSCSRKTSTHNKISPNRFFPPQDSMVLEKLNLKRNSKGSISDRTYRPLFKNSDSNSFIILTPKSAKTEIDINEDNAFEFEKLTPDFTNYSYVDSDWTENFLKDFKAKGSQENFHLQISTPTSEETSPRKNKDSSPRSGKITSRKTAKESQVLKTSPKSANNSKSSSRSLKVEDVTTPKSENRNYNIKREKRREKMRKSFSNEANTANRIGYVKSPKSFKSTTEEKDLDHQKSIKGNLRKGGKTDNFKLKGTNYTSHKLTESFETGQSTSKSSRENFSSKLENSRQSSPNSTKNHSASSNKNGSHSSCENFKKDSERSIASNNSSFLMRNNVKESNTQFLRLKSPESGRNSELRLLLPLESPKYQATNNTSGRSEDSFRKSKSAASKTSSFEVPKSNSDSESYENFQEDEKFNISDRQKPQAKSEKNSGRTENEFAENHSDKFFYRNNISPAGREYHERKEMRKFQEEEGELSRSEDFREEFLFYSSDRNPKRGELSSRISICNQNEKSPQKIDETLDSRRENNSCSKISSRSSSRSYAVKPEEDILDREKAIRSKSSSRKSSHRTLSIIDEMSNEALLKSVESFEEGTSKIHSRRSSGIRHPHKSESFINLSEKIEDVEEKANGGSKTDRCTSSTLMGEMNKKRREINSFEKFLWQDLIERFDEPDENSSNNSANVNKFPGFPRKKSQSQNSKESIISSSEIQNKISTSEIKEEKDFSNSEPKTVAIEKNSSKLQIKAEDCASLPTVADNQEKLDKRNPYSLSEYNSKKDQQSKTFYFDVKMMDNQKIGEFGDVTCCSIGKFEISSSGKPNVYGDGDQGGITGWDQITANSLLEKTKKDIDKKPQRQLWTEVNSTFKYEKPVLGVQKIQKADLNFTEYFPMNSFKVLSATVDNYQGSRSAKSLSEEIHVKGNALPSIKAPTLSHRYSNSLKDIATSQENCNEIKFKQSTYTSTGDLFEITFQNSNEEKEFSDFNIFLANKKKCDKNVRAKNWLTIGHGKYDSEKSFRKSKLKKKENLLEKERTSSGRSRPSIPPLRFKNTNCFQNFYKRIISTFCITSHSSASTSK